MVHDASRAGNSGEYPQLATLIDMTSPEAVHREVIHILELIDPNFDWQTVQQVFYFSESLYNGHHLQYEACDIDYHNFSHITDTYLAMARLVHGAILEGENISGQQISNSLVASLLHDSGMIRHKDETAESGAEYVKEHVRRSMDFVERHSGELELTDQEVRDVRDMILCTDLGVDVKTIPFSSETSELLGKILGTADLIGQMADRTYLEKLLFLFHEFRTADIGDSESELEFLHKTLDFYEMCDRRFDEILDGTYRFMVFHFKERWNIDANLYLDSLNKQRSFLGKILTEKNGSPYDYLKRSGIVQEVRRKFGKSGLKTDAT